MNYDSVQREQLQQRKQQQQLQQQQCYSKDKVNVSIECNKKIVKMPVASLEKEGHHISY